MSAQEYGLKFTKLSTYAPHMVVDLRSKISKFLFGVFDLVKTECMNAIMLKDTNIYRQMSHAQHVKEDMLTKMAKDNKKART